jgi:hypothetical protein
MCDIICVNDSLTDAIERSKTIKRSDYYYMNNSNIIDGDYVYLAINDKGKKLKKKKIQRINSVIARFQDDEVVYLYMCEDYILSVNHFEAIPITFELLTKLGFDWVSKLDGRLKKGNTYIQKQNDGTFVMTNELKEQSIQVQYIHEVQNVYKNLNLYSERLSFNS